MAKYSQTMARLGAGYSVIGATIWLLWPSSMSFADNPEAWLVLATTVFVWHATELKHSEELGAGKTTPQDIRVARRLVDAHRGNLRYLLNDVPLWSFVDADIYREMRQLIDDEKKGDLFFSQKKLQSRLADFVSALENLSRKVATDTTETMIGGTWMIGYKPNRNVDQTTYDKLMSESKRADALADTAWDLLEHLVADIRVQIPEAYSEDQQA